MLSTAWPAPAKLNLFLHITGQRTDGYHLLQTVFQFIDLVDYIDFNILNSDKIVRRSNLPDVKPENDLVIQAAHSLKEYTNCKFGVEINVKKNIPVGGGLGGGSSNAATTLHALNQLWDIKLGVEELASLGLKLGADVPVFIHAHAAWAEGVGEKLTPIEPQEDTYLLIYPGCSVNTAGIFRSPDLTRNTPAITIRAFLEAGGKNDCESVVRDQYEEVTKALDWLSNFAPARLTGTGSCLFAVFSSRQEALEVNKQLPENWKGYVVNGMNRSPLLERLVKESSSS
ncbi:MAG: 4-(cytidine 5'-diphospho)-2-C-methyl-D-erythritol kinase [Proteobacteria bacterium]|nr:4-(cytidine 5'-diphospho)-2-C-methyl-D-erythritol kinase [Pseudomonadota bacterium]